MRKAFVADVSHELRTPLTVIQGHVEMMLDSGKAEESDQLALKRIDEQSARMKTIVEDLLTLSRLESYRLTETEGEWINPAALIHSLINNLSVRGRDSQHAFNLSLSDMLTVKGIEQELHSCCQNLIQNALAYTPAGTQIDIEWRQAAADERYPVPQSIPVAEDEASDPWRPANYAEPVAQKITAWLIVRDYGPGIEKEHLPRLSERFYRADKARSRSTGGTGLGLAIVKHIAQRHGGQLLISSQLGKGSQFAVGFPLERISAGTTSATAGDTADSSNVLVNTERFQAGSDTPADSDTNQKNISRL